MTAPTGTTARVLSLLRIAAEAEGAMSIKEIAGKMGLAQSTVHRMFDLLCDAGFTQHDPQTRRYNIGAEFYRIATLVTASHSFGDIAKPFLSSLTEQTGETAAFALYLSGTGEMIFSTVSDSPKTLRYRLNSKQRYPIAWGASGHAILAHLPDAERTGVIANTGPSPVSGEKLDIKLLEKKLADVHRNGWAFSRGEKISESVGVASPVFAAGRVTGCIALTIPSIRFDEAAIDDLGQLVKQTATALSTMRGKERDE